MGAEISSEREFPSYRDDQFAEKYRQKYGNSAPGPAPAPISAEEIMEQIKSERIMLEQQRKYDSTLNREGKSKSDDEFYRKRDQNYKIIHRGYERDKNEYRRRGESEKYRRQRSRRERDDDYRRRRSRSRRHESSRSRSRSQSSSSSGNKENKKGSRSRSRSKSATDGHDKKHSTRSKSNSRDPENTQRKSKKSDSYKRHSSPERKSRKNSRSKENSVSKSEKDSTSDKNKSRKQKKKKQNSQVVVYKSTPDLTASQRQYGVGPWQRTHDYFNNFEQRPQSWVAELSHDATIPGPIIERQIVYGLPATLPATMPRAVDGMGYPLKQNNPGFHPVPYQTYLMQKPARARSMEFYGTRANEPSVSIQPTQRHSAAMSPASPTKDSTLVMQTSPKIIATNARPVSENPPNALYATVNKNRTNSRQPVIRQTSYEVQAHLQNPPTSRVQRILSDSSSILPNYKSPPRYGDSEKKTPAAKPRVKVASRDRNKKTHQTSKNLNVKKKVTADKKNRPKITAATARENFEGLLALDYDMMKPLSTGEFSEEFQPTFPDTYRANQEIFVDDVVFRQHPRIISVSDSDSSDMITDEEHVLTLGEEFSPTSYDSSGNDLDIPEGFKFEVEEANLRKNRKTQTVVPKSAVILTSAQKRKQREIENRKIAATKNKHEHITKGTQTKAKAKSQHITKPIILSSVEPVMRKSKKTQSPERKTARNEMKVQKSISPTRQSAHREKSPTRKQKASTNHAPSPQPLSRRQRSSSMDAEFEITPVRAPRSFERPKQRAGKPLNGVPVLPVPQVKKTKNKRIQHPTKDGTFIREIVPSRNWEKEQKSEPKKMHNKSTGTPTNKKQKSVAVQTKTREPAKPLYFLKPISSHEVFIDDTITSPSEASLSSAMVSSLVSQTSTLPRSDNTSWTKSSGSSGTEIIDGSEVESVVVNNFQKNSHLYSSKRQKENSSVISVDSSEHSSDKPNLGPPSMKLGVSESIQASSFSRRDGKVFCLTRSRCSSSPPPLSLPGKQNQLYTEQEDLTRTDDEQIEPVKNSDYFNSGSPIMFAQTIDRAIVNSQIQPDPTNNDYRNSAQVARKDDFQFFNPDDVKLWVLDCYVQDQKMTNRAQQMKVEGYRGQSPPEPPENNVYRNEARDQQEYRRNEAMQEIPRPSPSPPIEPPHVTVAPLTTEHLLAHQDIESSKYSKKKYTASTTDASLDFASDVGAFQREVMKAKHKIWKKRQRQQEPDPADPSEQYKGRLKQWNNSPTSNVVLAECCAVTDVDNGNERNRSTKMKQYQGSKKAEQNVMQINNVSERKYIPDQNEGVYFPAEQRYPREERVPYSGNREQTHLQSQDDKVLTPDQNFRLKSGSREEHVPFSGKREQTHLQSQDDKVLTPDQNFRLKSGSREEHVPFSGKREQTHLQSQDEKVPTPDQNFRLKSGSREEHVPFSENRGQTHLQSQDEKVPPPDQNYWLKSGSQTMDNIDKFLEELDQGKIQALAVNPQLRQKQEVALSASEDWRVVNDRTSVMRSKADPGMKRDLRKDVNDNHPRMDSKQEEENYVIPNYQVKILRRASMDSLLDTTSKNSDPSNKTKDSYVLGERSSSLHSLRNEGVPSSPVTNPFLKMDSEDVTSYLGNSAKDLFAVDSEKDILEALEKSRERRKSETLEERTARILGIHRRKYSSDEEHESSDDAAGEEIDDKSNKPSAPPRNRDLSSYMNNLLTGVTDVSPASRERFEKELNPKSSAMNSLQSVENSYTAEDTQRKMSDNSRNGVSSLTNAEGINHNGVTYRDGAQFSQDEHSDESSSTNSATVAETFSVNVSDSVLEAPVDCEVRKQMDHGAPTSPKEYKIPDVSERDVAASPTDSKRRDVMVNYTMNIYANNPKFHQKQQSFDTTESEETDLDASFNSSSNGQDQVNATLAIASGKTDLMRVQDSPVPISSNSAPLTNQEIEIVKKLYDENTASKSSSNSHEETEMSSTESERSKPPSIESNLLYDSDTSRSSQCNSPRRSPSRASHMKKIAKSIGFTLNDPQPIPSDSGEQPSFTDTLKISMDRDEKLFGMASAENFDIKILGGKRNMTDEEMQNSVKCDIATRQNPGQVEKLPQNDVHNAEQGRGLSPETVSRNKEGVNNVMESLGLNPDEAWLFSV